MSSVETFLLAQESEASTPILYIGYEDDILTIFKNNRHIKLLYFHPPIGKPLCP